MLRKIIAVVGLVAAAAVLFALLPSGSRFNPFATAQTIDPKSMTDGLDMDAVRAGPPAPGFGPTRATRTPVQRAYEAKVREQIAAFDQCTDDSIYRGARFSYDLCVHIIAEAKAYSDRAGLGYNPSKQFVMDMIRAKIARRYGGIPPRATPTEAPFAY